MPSDTLFQDNDFYGLNYEQRQRALAGTLSKPENDPEFAKLPPEQQSQAVAKILEKHGVGEQFDALHSKLLNVENAPQDPKAVSPKGARGLGQIMPDTARQYGLNNPDDLFDPGINKKLSRKILADMLVKAKLDPHKALVGYNAGPGRMDNAPPESEDYAAKVLASVDQSKPQQVSFPDAVPGQYENQPPAEKLPKGTAKAIGAGALKMGGTVLGGAAGAGAGPLGMGALAATGYGLGQNAAQSLGLEENPGMLHNLLNEGTTGAAIAGGAAGGPAGFAGATELANAVSTELEKRVSGVGEGYKPQEPGKYLQFPGGAPLERMGLNALVDLGVRIGAKIPEKLSGLNAAKTTARTAQDEQAAKLATESGDLEHKATGAIQDAQAKRDVLDENQLTKAEGTQQDIERGIRKEYGPQQTQHEMERFLGADPEHLRSAQAIAPEASGVISDPAQARRAWHQNAIFKPIRRIGDEMGARYENLFRDHLETTPSTEPLRTTIESESAYFRDTNVPLSTQARSLLDHASELAPQGIRGSGGPILGRFTEAEWGQLTPAQRSAAIQESTAAGNTPRTQPANPTTIQNLIGLRRQSSALIANAASPAEKRLGFQIRNAVDDIYENTGIHGVAELNAKYKSFRDMFRPGFQGKVSAGFDPSDYGKQIFGEPQRAMTLWNAANGEERAALRESLADHVFDSPNTRKALQSINSAVLRQYFGNTAFSRVEPWINLRYSMDQLANASPEARSALTQGVQEQAQKLEAERARDMLKSVKTVTKQIGPAGRAIEAQIFKAPTLDEKAKIASDFLESIDPQQVSKAMRDTKTSPPGAAVEALAKVSPGALATSIKHRLAWAATIGIGEAMIGGHLSPYTGMMAGVGLLSAPSLIVRGVVTRSLRNPKIAETFVKALNSGDYRRVGNMIADTAATQGMQGENKQ